MSVEIKYKGNTIASASTDTTKTIKTSGKYCEADIEVVNTQDGGITPTGNINITDTNPTDVTNYATAQVVDADLVAENIKKDVNILGVVGSFEGGGGGGISTPWASIAVQDVVIGVNSVTNPINATAYFEGIVGTDNLIGVLLQNTKTSYANNELIIMCGRFIGSGSTASNTLCKRYRNGGLNDFQTTSGYDVKLVEGETYQVLYYSNQP